MSKINSPLAQSFANIKGVEQSKTLVKPQKPEQAGASKAFADMLVEKTETPLLFSKHAQKRLESRGIELSSDDIMKMQDAVKRASDKGAKESLILSDKGAFVVSVKNGTVITAVDRGSMKESIFTNIDSTIMI